MPEFLSASEAVARIGNGTTLAIGGTGPVLDADAVLAALEQRFLDSGAPRDLTLFSPWLPGDASGTGGLNAIAHEGMLKKLIGATFSIKRHPRLIELVGSGKCEGYTVGMGIAVQMLGAIAAGKPGMLTTVGIDSFLDPRVEGGCMNARSTTPPVKLQQIDGEDYLYYPSFPIDVAVIRATTADENGYLSFEEEPNLLGTCEMAAATRASGGLVIAQVKRLAQGHSLDPRTVRVPGALVDIVVVNPEQKQISEAMRSPLHGWDPSMTGAIRRPLGDMPRVPDGIERLIVRRAALELKKGDIVNVGGGMATQLPRIALEEGALDRVVFTNEHGIFGGLMAIEKGSFVPAFNPDAIMDSSFQFGFYEGGGLDITFLGMGQMDRHGNVNVSKFGKMWNGPGGFNTITERTRRIVFCGSMTAGGLRVEARDGQLKIESEGRVKKLVPDVEQITLNGPRAHAQGQKVTYITERAVFELGPDGPVLTEVAPGVDIEGDIKAHIGFDVAVAPEVRTMPAALFTGAALGLAKRLS